MRTIALGTVVVTCEIDARMQDNPAFAAFVLDCIRRHTLCDWGDVYEDDKALNDRSIEGPEQDRVMSVYLIDPAKGREAKDNVIWIITEWDRSATTVLYPHEY